MGGGGHAPKTPLACSDCFTVLTGDTWAPTFTPGLPDGYCLQKLISVPVIVFEGIEKFKWKIIHASS